LLVLAHQSKFPGNLRAIVYTAPWKKFVPLMRL
jgi:hypothetical protein